MDNDSAVNELIEYALAGGFDAEKIKDECGFKYSKLGLKGLVKRHGSFLLKLLDNKSFQDCAREGRRLRA